MSLALKIGKILLRLLYRVQEFGLESLPKEKSLIIANHDSLLDGVLLACFLPSDTIFVIHRTVMKNPLYRILVRFVTHEIVESQSPLSLKRIVKLIKEGRNVVLFPEGRISTTAGWMKIYAGPAFVLMKTGACLFPLYIKGSKNTLFSRLKGKWPQKWFPTITLHAFGTQTLPSFAARKMREKRLKMAEAMRQILQTTQCRAHSPRTLYQHLREATKLFGASRVIAKDARGTFTYQDLNRMAVGLSYLIAKFTAESETVGILLPNIMATVMATIGLSARHRIPALLNYSNGIEVLKQSLEIANVRTIVSSKVFIEKARLQHVVEVLKEHYKIIYLEDLKALVGWKEKLVILFQSYFHKWSHIQNLQATAVVLFTSGSEGKPKGVALSHVNLSYQLAQLQSVLDLNIQDKILACLPLFHAFGLMGGALLPLMTGVYIVMYLSPLHYRTIPELAYDQDCTLIFGTATFLNHYGQAAHPLDFLRIRYCMSGAEKLPEAVRTLWMEKFGIRILEGYGTTEASPVLALNVPYAYKQGSVGQLLPLIESKLVAVEGLPNQQALCVSGPNLMKGYLGCADYGAWYNTGDCVRIDADGFIFIDGRVKRFAKIAGESVSLDKIEHIMHHLSPEAQHAAVNIPCPKKGEAIILYTTDAKFTRFQMQEYVVAEGASELFLPRKIVHLETLPVLGSGKINYPALKNLAEGLA